MSTKNDTIKVGARVIDRRDADSPARGTLVLLEGSIFRVHYDDGTLSPLLSRVLWGQSTKRFVLDNLNDDAAMSTPTATPIRITGLVPEHPLVGVLSDRSVLQVPAEGLPAELVRGYGSSTPTAIRYLGTAFPLRGATWVEA